VNTVTRSWAAPAGVTYTGSYNPFDDCDLTNPEANTKRPGAVQCGAIANPAFGRLTARTTNYDPDLVEGWHTRPNNWAGQISIQRELMPRVSGYVGYTRRWFGNLFATRNLAVSNADFTPYCITLPTDSRLQKSGQQICGLYDLNVNKVGLVDQVVTLAKNFGDPKDVYNGGDVTFQYRRGRLNAGGGWNIGNSIQTGVAAGGNVNNSSESCFVVDTPQDLFNCKVNNPYQSRIKLNGAWQIPWQDIQLALVFQNNPGPGYTANITYANAQIAPTLGRNLSVGTTRTIQVAEPNTLFGDRISQMDIRASKFVRFGGRRIQLNADLYNAFNANNVIEYFATYNLADQGAAWKRPTESFR
jgi:hypothetical protein